MNLTICRTTLTSSCRPLAARPPPALLRCCPSSDSAVFIQPRVYYSSGAPPRGKDSDRMSLSSFVEKEVGAKSLNSLPTFGTQWGSNFSDGSRRLPFNPTQLLKPSDLNPINLVHPADRETRKPRPIVRRAPTKAEVRLTDPFLYYDIDILKEPYNPELLSSFLTPLGRIKKRAHTGLSKANQKKVAKAVRRARCMGFLPYFGKPLERYSEENQQRRDGPGVDLPAFAR